MPRNGRCLLHADNHCSESRLLMAINARLRCYLRHVSNHEHLTPSPGIADRVVRLKFTSDDHLLAAAGKPTAQSNLVADISPKERNRQ